MNSKLVPPPRLGGFQLKTFLNGSSRCKSTLLAVVLAVFAGCSSTAVYSPGPKGSVKRFQSYGDIRGPFILKSTSNSFSIETKEFSGVYPVARIALRDESGNLLTDKSGNAVYSEIPLIPGLYNSSGTDSSVTGISTIIRSTGSVAGTAISSMVGVGVIKSISK